MTYCLGLNNLDKVFLAYFLVCYTNRNTLKILVTSLLFFQLIYFLPVNLKRTSLSVSRSVCPSRFFWNKRAPLLTLLCKKHIFWPIKNLSVRTLPIFIPPLCHGQHFNWWNRWCFMKSKLLSSIIEMIENKHVEI